MFRARPLIALLLIAAACSDGVVEPPIDGEYVALTVEGAVKWPDGSPVAGALLDIRARGAATCSGDVSAGTAISSSAGVFTRPLGTWGAPRDVCVWIEVYPPPGSGLARDTITVESARLDFVAPTVSLDIVLSAAQ